MDRRNLLSGGAALAAMLALPRDAQSAVVNPPAITPSGIRSIKRGRNLQLSLMPNSRHSLATVTASSTYCTQFALESGFDLVRLVYRSSGSPYTIAGAVVSPSASSGLGSDPINASGATDQTMWQRVYFNNGGVATEPQDQTLFGSGASTFAVPTGDPTHQSLYYSDWVRVRSLDRIDAGVYPLLMIRNLTDATGLQQYASMTTSPTWLSLSQGREIVTRAHTAFDGVTTPGAIGSAALNVVMIPDGIQYYSSVPGVSVLAIGDSLTQGQGSTDGYHPWGYLSCLALSKPQKPISFWNQGWTGQTTTDFAWNGYQAFKSGGFDVVVIPPWSPNDPHTLSAAQASWSRALDCVQRVLRDRKTPVIMGPLPYETVAAGAEETARLWVRGQMLAACSQGLACIDWDTVPGLCTGANPNRVNPIFIGTVTANHPNDAGYQLMDSGGFRPVLAAIIRDT